MFNPLKWKIWGVVGVVIITMFAFIKKLLADKAELEHDAKIKDIVKENADKQIVDIKEVLADEKNKIDDDDSDKSRDDQFIEL